MHQNGPSVIPCDASPLTFNGDRMCLVHLSGRLLKHPYHAACCLMEAWSAGLEVHSKLTRPLGEFLPFVHAADRTTFLNGSVRS